MRISYSSYKNYIECPRKYKYMLDRRPTPEKESKYFALYGITVQKFFEDYCNFYLPQGKDFKSKDEIYKAVKQRWDYILSRPYNYVKWDDPWCRESSDQIFNSVYLDVLAIMEKIKIFESCKSEVKMGVKLKNSGDELFGRIDFIYKNPVDSTVEILDGKGTAKMDKNVDPEQLYFYALLYLLTYKKLPDKIGFIYWRYQVIHYLDINMDILMEFKNKFALVKKSIKKDKEYKPKVGLSKGCKYCPYKVECDAWMQKKEANMKRKEERDKAKGLVIDAPKTGGVITLEL